MPDWQIGCIDSKWRWSLPWSVSAAALLISMVVVTSLWNDEMLKSLSRYVNTERSLEFSLSPTDKNVWQGLYPKVFWINGIRHIHVGGKGSHFRRLMFYRHHLIRFPPPVAELHRRFSKVPWDAG